MSTRIWILLKFFLFERHDPDMRLAFFRTARTCRSDAHVGAMTESQQKIAQQQCVVLEISTPLLQKEIRVTPLPYIIACLQLLGYGIDEDLGFANTLDGVDEIEQLADQSKFVGWLHGFDKTRQEVIFAAVLILPEKCEKPMRTIVNMRQCIVPKLPTPSDVFGT